VKISFSTCTVLAISLNITVFISIGSAGGFPSEQFIRDSEAGIEVGLETIDELDGVDTVDDNC
jgi:hypothetical protein